MREGFLLGLAFGIGLGVGLFYFGGLWLTVRRLASSRRPELLMLFSLAFRLIVCLAAFYLVMAGAWERLVVCLVSFFLMRTLLVHLLGPARHALPPTG